MQKDGTLGKNRAKDDLLLQRFQEGKLLMVNIPLPTNAGDERKFIFSTFFPFIFRGKLSTITGSNFNLCPSGSD